MGICRVASTAESFRSTCGSDRGAPDWSKQRFPGAAPHVGQRTENNCFVVSSLFFIYIRCGKGNRSTVPSGTLLASTIGNARSYGTAKNTGIIWVRRNLQFDS